MKQTKYLTRRYKTDNCSAATCTLLSTRAFLILYLNHKILLYLKVLPAFVTPFSYPILMTLWNIKENIFTKSDMEIRDKYFRFCTYKLFRGNEIVFSFSVKAAFSTYVLTQLNKINTKNLIFVPYSIYDKRIKWMCTETK